MDPRDRALDVFRSLVVDPSERVRARTAQQLRWLGPGAVPLLRRAVRDSDRSVRLCAIRALGKIGTPAAVEVLAGEFEPDDGEHLFYVLRSLGFSTAPVDLAVAHIETGLGSPAPELQAVMAAPLVLKLARETPELIYEISLVRLIEVVPEAFEVCGRLLVGEDSKRRDELLKNLWWAQRAREAPTPHTPIFAELSSLIDQPLPSFERHIVAELLESCGTRAVPALGALLTTARQTHEQRRICEALGRLGGAPTDLIPVLTDLLFEFETSEAAAELLVGMDRSARADLLERIEARLQPAKYFPDGVFTLFARLSPDRLERWIELGLKARKPFLAWIVAKLEGRREEYRLHLWRESVGQALHAMARCRPEWAARPGFVGTLERRALAGEEDRSKAVKALGCLLPDTLSVFTKLLSLTQDSRHRETIFEALTEAVQRRGSDASDPLIDLVLLCLDGDRGRYLVDVLSRRAVLGSSRGSSTSSTAPRPGWKGTPRCSSGSSTSSGVSKSPTVSPPWTG